MTCPVKSLVLVADDNLGLLEMMARYLEKSNYRTAVAPNKTELLRQLAKERPDLLVMDLQFGEHNGIEVMQQLLKTDAELCITILTGNGSIESAVSAIKLGAHDYLTKPPDMQRLQVILKHALEKRNLSQRIKNLEQLV